MTVHEVDERYTTTEALSSGAPGARARAGARADSDSAPDPDADTDAVAAALILEQFMRALPQNLGDESDA